MSERKVIKLSKRVGEAVKGRVRGKLQNGTGFLKATKCGRDR